MALNHVARKLISLYAEIYYTTNHQPVKWQYPLFLSTILEMTAYGTAVVVETH